MNSDNPTEFEQGVVPHADFILAERVEQAPEYAIGPVQGLSRDQVADRFSLVFGSSLVLGSSSSPDEVEPEEDLGSYQWSLKEIAAVTTFAAVGLAGATWMPAPLFAGLVGAASFLGVYFGGTVLPESRRSQWFYLGLFAMYATAVLSVFLAR